MVGGPSHKSDKSLAQKPLRGVLWDNKEKSPRNQEAMSAKFKEDRAL